MARIGYGYGSEWHLMHYLGRHRAEFDRLLTSHIGAEAVDWLDAPWSLRSGVDADDEWKSLDFLDNAAVRNEWRDYWPHGRGIQTWDAVARIRRNSGSEWLLVEAKAHTGELKTSCCAGTGLTRIAAAFDATKGRLRIPSDRDWLHGYYQYANRLAALDFLEAHGEPARLLFVYFIGDRFEGRDCPDTEERWRTFLTRVRDHLGLPESHALLDRVHSMFVPVNPRLTNDSIV